ncbi:hypothetical protein BD769DRAFT_434845 [Suillus cothurnatus]|nr:hypothetical protein BD769DRAFT_434845 [Suillus cothurnatus]
MESGFRANEISFAAASDFIQSGDAYEWVRSHRPGISVANRAPHEDLFALATLFDDGSANPFWTFTLPQDGSREFSGSIYVHAFRTTGVTPGSQHDFSDPEFLANRITERNGCEVSELGPMTYWYIHEHGNRLKVKIGKSRKDIKRYKHQLRMGSV